MFFASIGEAFHHVQAFRNRDEVEYVNGPQEDDRSIRGLIKAALSGAERSINVIGLKAFCALQIRQAAGVVTRASSAALAVLRPDTNIPEPEAV